MIAELLFDNLIDSQDILVSDLLFLAVEHLRLEFLDIIVDLIRCGLDACRRCVNIVDLNIYTWFKRINSLVKTVYRL